jgi:hypothetical protein
MIGTTPVARAILSGSTAYATYEVIYADPSVQETATIPVAVAFTNKPCDRRSDGDHAVRAARHE